MTEVLEVKEEKIINEGPPAGEERVFTERPPGVAPIKPEFIVKKSPNEETTSTNGDQSKPSKNKQRGMNKKRRNEMHKADLIVRAKTVRLCHSAFRDVPCKFGEKCNSEHDIKKFLEQKPTDLGENCPVFDFRGTCPFSYACRFGNAHVDAEGKQATKKVDSPYEETLNSHSSTGVLFKIRKKQYDYSKSKEILKAIKENRIGSMEREPVRLDMKSIQGKRYLAPLTTVGNLPFRRMCVDLGAEVTCGEMALATCLLAGNASEYSLIKRHPSEKIFGVQLAGGYPDAMTMAAELIADNFEVDFIDINCGCPIDLINDKGAGCALPTKEKKLFEVISGMKNAMEDIPLTVKLRTGLKEGILTADKTISYMAKNCRPDLITFHPRSKEQRYSKAANWSFVEPCVKAADGVPFFRLEKNPIDGIMIARGALIKPWIFTEIAERRNWDIRSNERLDLVKKFVDYGLDHWGSDDMGVEKTRRFLLETLSFQCSPRASDWVKISEMFLGKTPEDFVFVPKHKANAY
ncbi:hypothetical protein WR25_19918 [Diploscapter pachys]|uniref:tRNA-dihydrouridine(47) synthase [NAD(P)(+)] n=1 Tax=Diploscapter pachys TaxID=2018661 RepID=A0A2A2LXK2_9BILA|nr:hypothetical protein WR25_19918 [Diploscapter pachys]